MLNSFDSKWVAEKCFVSKAKAGTCYAQNVEIKDFQNKICYLDCKT
jgi:hypothetical protein